jgi:hypothetical protein
MYHSTAGRALTVNLGELGIRGSANVRNLWSRTDLRSFRGSYRASLAQHACELIKVVPENEKGNQPHHQQREQPQDSAKTSLPESTARSRSLDADR